MEALLSSCFQLVSLVSVPILLMLEFHQSFQYSTQTEEQKLYRNPPGLQCQTGLLKQPALWTEQMPNPWGFLLCLYCTSLQPCCLQYVSQSSRM